MNKNMKKYFKVKNFLISFLLIGSLFVLMSTSRVLAISTQKKEAITKFINDNKSDLFIVDSSKVKIKDIQEDNGLFKVLLDLDGEEQIFYLTDSSKLVLQFVSLDKISKGSVKQIGKLNGQGRITIDKNTKEEIKKFVEKYLLQGKVTIDIGEVKEEDGLYKIDIKIKDKSQPLYLSLTGKKMAFEIITVADYKKRVKAEKELSEVSADKKNDKPKVDLFVMSYCPYGTQIEKGILPVFDLLKDKIDAKIRFVSYAMHNKKEIDENLLQYCIQKESPDNLNSYLKCFLKDGKSKDCLKEVGLSGPGKKKTDSEKKSFFSKIIAWFKNLFGGDNAKNTDKMKEINNCIAQTDKEFKITDNYNDKSTWNGQFPVFNIDKKDNEKYGIKGSPTLIINGEKISTGRDSKSLLRAICSGFKTPPKECQKSISSKAPAPGFGEGAAKTNSSGGGCGQ